MNIVHSYEIAIDICGFTDPAGCVGWANSKVHVAF